MQTLQFLSFLELEAKTAPAKVSTINSLNRMACYWEDLGFFFIKNYCWNSLENLQVLKVLEKRM